MFIESLKDPESHNIIKLHKKIEKRLTGIFDNTNKLKEKQIKGESQLQDLAITCCGFYYQEV